MKFPTMSRFAIPAAILLTISTGCSHYSGCLASKDCGEAECGESCSTGSCSTGSCGSGLFGCKLCGGGAGMLGGCLCRRHKAIPDTLPLGSTIRAHFHTMQTNAEASEFIMHRHEFVRSSSELSPVGKDHIVEIAARAKSAPFPVVIERSENNADPELDALRRNMVATILTDLGVPEADQRTFVAPGYNKAANSVEASTDYFQHIFTRGNNFNNGGFAGGGGGGVGGGVGGGGGF
ncbi:hypothetical protein [Stratiformator vulcanicus]|uniref:Lipoprotein n=1 Tax=Stratiformator vulcanicus TaxID=2527980 RepID=A0A517R4Y6_9PLAN|nr:hypothetical protein [Stratiformator vulcanicus]QDT38944.1 hypothetical protein Pan189_33440 [Stratiformator vulcanicus]